MFMFSMIVVLVLTIVVLSFWLRITILKLQSSHRVREGLYEELTRVQASCIRLNGHVQRLQDMYTALATDVGSSRASRVENERQENNAKATGHQEG